MSIPDWRYLKMGQKVEIYMTQQGTRVVIPATQGENLAREYDFTVIGLDGQQIGRASCRERV